MLSASPTTELGCGVLSRAYSIFSANVRFNLIHRPLSDFFIVYNESQYADITQPPGRVLVVEYTQMFAF